MPGKPRKQRRGNNRRRRNIHAQRGADMSAVLSTISTVSGLVSSQVNYTSVVLLPDVSQTRELMFVRCEVTFVLASATVSAGAFGQVFLMGFPWNQLGTSQFTNAPPKALSSTNPTTIRIRPTLPGQKFPFTVAARPENMLAVRVYSALACTAVITIRTYFRLLPDNLVQVV